MLIEIGQKAKETSYILGKMGTDLKNAGLLAAAQEILDEEDEILKANAADVAKAKERGMAPGLVDRLELNHKRIEGIVEGMRQVVGLEDPVGEVISMKRRPNGLLIGQKRVPFGVIGIIYEARPNVTADAFALCFKTGNAVILRGGSDALESNKAIVTAIRNGLKKEGIPEDAISLIEDTSHETAREFMRMNGYLDVLIPRGGAGLIRTVVENSTVPVIETGTGNCHIYVDESADFDMALDIIFNAKTQRIGVCNACESTLVHRKIAKEFLPLMKKRLDEKNVEIRADEGARSIVPEFTAATEEDWGKYAFSREPLEGRFSNEQKMQYTHKANDCGREWAEKIARQYGTRNPRELAEKLGMKVKTPKVPVGGGLVLFAQFVEPDEITIFTDCVDKASKLEEECGCDLLRRENLTNTLLAHELFHAVEERHVKEIYTRTERVELWRKPFSNKSKISCLSEIAAMAFAGKLLDLKVSPYMLDVLLVYSYDKNAAWGLYDEIMNMTKKQ